MRKSNSLVLAGLIAAMAALQACEGKKEAPPPPPPPPPVKVATVLQKDVPIYLEAIGQTRGSTEIEVRARVKGYLQTVDFKEGTPVRKGQLLYTIDPSPFQATLAQAKGALAGAEADLARAQQDVVRYRAAGRRERDPAAGLRDRRGAAACRRGGGRGGQGHRRERADRPRLHEGLRADDGLIGKTEVYPGTLVGPGSDTLLTHISQIEPIHVRFTLPERDYLRLARRREEQGRSTETPTAPLELVLADGAGALRAGQARVRRPQRGPETGTILLEAAFPNPDGIVRPGQYARVRAAVETKKGAILVPAARGHGAAGDLQRRRRRRGRHGRDAHGDAGGSASASLWVIDSGLKAGDTDRRRGPAEGARRREGHARGRHDRGRRRCGPRPAAPSPTRPTSTERAGIAGHGGLLHPAPDRRDRHLDHHRPARPQQPARAELRAVPVPRAADDPRHRHLPRRRRRSRSSSRSRRRSSRRSTASRA